MLSDPTIVPLTVILLLLVTIAIVQNLYKVAGFLVFTYVLYLLIIWVRMEPVPSMPSENHGISNNISPTSETISNSDSFIAAESTIDPDTTDEISDIIQQVYIPIKVKSISMTDRIIHRSPARIDSVFSDSLEHIYCFSSIENLNNTEQTISHKWYYENQFFSTVDIQVGFSFNWRCWSRISNVNEWPGNWKVYVLDSNEVPLDSISFTISNSKETGLRRVQ